MGVGAGLGLDFGKTKGQQIEEQHRSAELIKQLENDKVKFTKENIVFITRDSAGRIVWLETGNSSAGLEHILHHNQKNGGGHVRDYFEKFGVLENEIPQVIKGIMERGNIVFEKKKEVNGNRFGYERVFRYHNKYLLLTGVGTNGFIITAYPLHEGELARRLRNVFSSAYL